MTYTKRYGPFNVTGFETGIDRFNLLAFIQIQAYVFVILNMVILTIFRA